MFSAGEGEAERGRWELWPTERALHSGPGRCPAAMVQREPVPAPRVCPPDCWQYQRRRRERGWLWIPASTICLPPDRVKEKGRKEESVILSGGAQHPAISPEQQMLISRSKDHGASRSGRGGKRCQRERASTGWIAGCWPRRFATAAPILFHEG
jgi:hypothetical protein